MNSFKWYHFARYIRLFTIRHVIITIFRVCLHFIFIIIYIFWYERQLDSSIPVEVLKSVWQIRNVAITLIRMKIGCIYSVCLRCTVALLLLLLCRRSPVGFLVLCRQSVFFHLKNICTIIELQWRQRKNAYHLYGHWSVQI